LRQQDKVAKAVAAEINAFQESILEVRRAGALGDRPLIVLTAANPYDPDPILTREQVEKLKNFVDPRFTGAGSTSLHAREADHRA
jgi:hypothetical protein